MIQLESKDIYFIEKSFSMYIQYKHHTHNTQSHSELVYDIRWLYILGGRESSEDDIIYIRYSCSFRLRTILQNMTRRYHHPIIPASSTLSSRHSAFPYQRTHSRTPQNLSALTQQRPRLLDMVKAKLWWQSGNSGNDGKLFEIRKENIYTWRKLHNRMRGVEK